MANATNVTKTNSTGTPSNGLYPPPMVANNTNTTDFADGYVVSAFPSEYYVSADSDTDPRPLSTAQWCWLNTTTPPVNWTEPPPPAPPGGWRSPKPSPPPARPSPPPPPYSAPSPPPPPPLPPDLTLNLSYPPAPAMRQWQILVPCNHTAPAPPGPDPLLLGFIDLYDPLTVFAFVFTVCSVLFYYLRRWQLREEAKRAERVPTLDDEIKRSANLRHIKSMFEEVDIEEEETEEEELDEWGRVKKKKKEPWWKRIKLDWSWEDVGAVIGKVYRRVKKFLFTATFGAPVSETSVSITEFIHIFQIDVRSEWAQRFIALLDADGNGTMEFQEFVVGVGTLSTKEKNSGATDFGSFCFKLLDLDNRGKLPREELLATVWRYVRYRECRANDKAAEIKAKTDYKDRYISPDIEAALNNHRRVVRDYRAKMYLGRDQNWDKLGKFNRSDGAEEVQQWAEDAAREAEVRDPRKVKETREEHDRRRRMADVRKKMRDAAAALRVEYPKEITPRDFQKFLDDFPDTFKPAMEIYKKLRPYARACARCVERVPNLRLDEMKAHEAAQVWRAGQKVTWFWDEDEEHRHRPTRQREDRDPKLLEEIATMAARRALTERARRSDGATRIGEHDEAAAESIDDRSAAISTTRDGGIRKDRGPPSVRVQGRGHALARTAEMRVNALIDAPPSEAAGDLAYLTTRARILALNMLPLEPCARIVHAMDPRRRAEVIDAVDPRVGEMVTQLLIDRGEAVTGEGATPRRDRADDGGQKVNAKAQRAMWEERRGRGGVLGLEYGLDVYSTQFGGGGGGGGGGGVLPGQLASPAGIEAEEPPSFVAQRAEELRLAFNANGDAMYVYGGDDSGFQPFEEMAKGEETAVREDRGDAWDEANTEGGRGDAYRIDIADR